MSRIRVAVDGRPLQRDPLGGVGRYVAGMLPKLTTSAEVFVLLDGRRPDPPAGTSSSAEPVRLHAPPGVPGIGWLELAVAPWLRRFGGLFHGTFNMVPLSFGGRAVLTLHDLAPQLHADDFRPAKRAAWRVWVRGSVRRARVLTTVSEFARREILAHFRLDPGRVLVARDAVDPAFDPSHARAAPALARSHGINLPYVVAVGGAQRRGLPIALEAWRQARGRTPTELGMAVLGEPGLSEEPGLVSLGALGDEDWATLLAGASALLYPTRYEGFGLPALEALASGTPVVCSPVASLPEVLGDAACWAPERSAEGIGAVLSRLLADEAWRRQQREAGLARARASGSWEETAEVLLEAYDRAAA